MNILIKKLKKFSKRNNYSNSSNSFPKCDKISKNNFIKPNKIFTLKIKTKFIIYITTIILLIILIASISITNMIKIKDNIDSIYNKELTGLTLLYPISTEFSNLYSSLDEVIKDSTAGGFNDLKAQIDFSISKINKLKSDFELTINSEEVQKEFEIAETDYESLINSINEITELSKAGNYQDAQFKNALISNTKSNITSNYNNMILLNQKFAKTNYESSNKVYKNSFYCAIAIVIISILLSIICSLLLSFSLSKKLKEIMKFSKAIGNNDFTYQIENISKDEIGEIIDALNRANKNIKLLVSDVIDTASNIRVLNSNISNISDDIVKEMTTINSSTALISDGSRDVSNSTINVTKSVEKIVSIASNLTSKAKESVNTSNVIKDSATKVKERGLQSVNTANNILIDKNNSVKIAIEKGIIVKEIVNMTNLIKDISQKTNLLSINASIEAANAGDKGKGFGVVANEVKNLANQTNDTVKNIQLLVKEIQEAFTNISITTSSVLNYLSTDVKSDYDLLLDIANNYENSASTMNEVAVSMEDYAHLVLDNINEVNAAIQNVTAISEESNSNTEEITLSISSTTDSINVVNKYIKEQNELTNKLNNLMQQFKI